MVPILCSIIFILLIIIFFQFYLEQKRKQNLVNIYQELNEIIEHQTNNKLLLRTDQHDMRLFLIQINRLLDHNQKVVADYTKTKLELRRMLSNMSHDFKTPLTVILGYIEKLHIDQNLTETDRKEIISMLLQKTRNVISLINKFFDLAKLESGDHFVSLSRIHLNEICRKNLIDFYELSQSKALEVTVDIPSTPIYILGNEEALNRILHNLLSNAIKYGSDGKILGFSLRLEDGQAFIDIWDKGKGISEIDQERVFERLYTLDDARHASLQGNGLGLSITKRLVEAMRGTIHLKSIPYEKTIFTCRFKEHSY